MKHAKEFFAGALRVWKAAGTRFLGLFVLLLLFPPAAKANFDFISLVSNNDASLFTASWEGVSDDTGTPAGRYFLLTKFGLDVNPLNGGTTSYTHNGTTGLSVTISTGPGSFCAVIVASSTTGGIFDTSNILCHSFLHNVAGGNFNAINRTDGNNTQLGFNQLWNFKYFLDADAEVTMRIHPPGTQFAKDGNGFRFPTGAYSTTTIVVDHTPRSGETLTGFSNQETWYSRDSSGTVVPNGLYFAHFLITNPLLSPTTRYADVFTIPVDVIRMMTLTTVGLTPTNDLATVNYTITGDAVVRIVIAKPGRQFTLDSSGDVQALNAAGTAIDTTTVSVISVLTFNRKAGTYAESWNGTDSTGVSVSTGVYSIGLSAKDGFGNQALDTSDNDGLIHGTLPVDRTAAQTATDNTAPSISQIRADSQSVSLSGGDTLTSGTFASITIILNEASGSGAAATTVSLSRTSAGAIAGAPSISGSTVTFTPTAAQSSTDTYTISIVPQDGSGNIGSLQTITFIIAPGVGAVTTVTAETFKRDMVPYPNPARSAPVSIDIVLGGGSDVDLDIFTVLGEKVFHQRTTGLSSGTNTLLWNLVNDYGNKVGSGVYLIRATAQTGSEKFSAVKKLMVIQ